MKALYGQDNPALASDVIEGRLIQMGMRALELGIHVVIDFGLWSRDERSALRHAAADVGATVVTCYFELSPAEQRNSPREAAGGGSARDLAHVRAGTDGVGFQDRHPDGG